MEVRDAAEDGTLLPGEGHLLVIDHMSDLTEAFRQAAPPR